MEPQKKSNGTLVGSIIIIIILIIGGYFVWRANVKKALDEKKIQSEDTDATQLNTLENAINETNVDVGANVIDSVE